mgnify:CR=1 FL=1
MGTITNLDSQKVHVRLNKDKEISFSPKLNPYFDQGWAITIHKSQGTTVDNNYVLASYEMNQNLSYVGMTRHGIKFFCLEITSCDFVIQILTKLHRI